MEFKIKINLENAAFKDDVNGEIARILRQLQGKILDNTPLEVGDNFSLFDINGGKVGTAVIE